jgi:hypothetical protein
VNPFFAVGYVLLGGALLALELVGVHRKAKRKGDGDTITEGYHLIEADLPGPLRWGYRVFTAGVLVWTLLHFSRGSWG